MTNGTKSSGSSFKLSAFSWTERVIWACVLVIGLITSWKIQQYKLEAVCDRVDKLEGTLERVNLNTLQYQVKDIKKNVDDIKDKLDAFITDYYRNQ